MGPHESTSRLVAELREFERQHPEVIVTRPTDTRSGLWEVSRPDSACMAFDSLHGMLCCLRMTDFSGKPGT